MDLKSRRSALGCNHSRLARILNDESRVYFEETRRVVFQGRMLAEVDADEAGKSTSWEKVRKGLADVGRWFDNVPDIERTIENE